uniref:U1620m n=1 Tax=Mycobacterium leprae TaxID=1769 RepID=Q49733_MYCLR|nr:u1620m [Mycobacterium leprae]
MVCLRGLAGFLKPILYVLSRYGVPGRALVVELGKGLAPNISSIYLTGVSRRDADHLDLENRARADGVSY